MRIHCAFGIILERAWAFGGVAGALLLALGLPLGIWRTLVGEPVGILSPEWSSAPGLVASWSMFCSIALMSALTCALALFVVWNWESDCCWVYVPFFSLRPRLVGLWTCVAPLPFTMFQFCVQVLLDGDVLRDAVSLGGFGMVILWLAGGNLLGYVGWSVAGRPRTIPSS